MEARDLPSARVLKRALAHAQISCGAQHYHKICDVQKSPGIIEFAVVEKVARK